MFIYPISNFSSTIFTGVSSKLLSTFEEKKGRMRFQVECVVQPLVSFQIHVSNRDLWRVLCQFFFELLKMALELSTVWASRSHQSHEYVSLVSHNIIKVVCSER